MNKHAFSTVEKMIDKFRSVHGLTYTYDHIEKYVPNEQICVECKLHGMFKISATAHLKGYGCMQCQVVDDDLYQRLYQSRADKLIAKFKLQHGDFYDYSKVMITIGDHDKINIICPIHGEFRQRAFDHARGCICPTCNKDHIRTSFRHSQESFIAKANDTHNFRYDYSKVNYQGNSVKVEIICSLHGSFMQTPTNHTDNKSGCPRCKNKWKMQDSWLDQLGVPRDPGHRQVNLRDHTDNRKSLIADGFDPSTNTVYEFLGDYHHGNPKLYYSTEVHCYSKLTLDKLHQQTIDRFNRLHQLGYRIIYIWENQYKKKSTVGYIFDLNTSLFYT
jgi:hypothetical protein